jgi:hypothetical protein
MNTVKLDTINYHFFTIPGMVQVLYIPVAEHPPNQPTNQPPSRSGFVPLVLVRFTMTPLAKATLNPVQKWVPKSFKLVRAGPQKKAQRTAAVAVAKKSSYLLHPNDNSSLLAV